MMKKILMIILMAVTMLTSCLKHDFSDIPENPKEQANTFDYSTVQTVTMNVDYSSCKAGSVFFSIYAENPMTDDSEPALNPVVEPVFEAFTNAAGIFNETVKLPAYVQHVYVYSGNLFVTDQLMECDVKNGIISATASENTPAGARALTRGVTSGQTTSLETLYQLTNIVDWRTGDDTGTRIYKDWNVLLGSWDAESGRPSYLMSPSDAKYATLSFSNEEMAGIQRTIAGALTAKKSCDAKYRQPYDLVLKENSEVAVTVVGANTCWNSTMGYYYYMDTPGSTTDLNIIMLFPNTQDGNSSFIKSKGNKYYGNIGLQRGDVVQLVYYPNIANGDFSGATTVFPKGMKIGFILKSNGWGMQKPVGDKVYYNSYKGDLAGSTISRQYNSWASSTEGMSYCLVDEEQNKADKGTYAYPNPSGAARTAKFAYQNNNGDQYAIVSFEDACNDDDYDDIVLALKPVNAFEELPTPDPKKTSVYGVYAFEDLWPAKGDYDLNDAVFDYSKDFLWTAANVGADYKISKETVNLTTYLNYVTLTSGLAVTVNHKVNPTSVKMKTIKSGVETEVQFEKDGDTYLLTDNILGNVGTQYVLEFEYSDGIAQNKTSDVYPFIYRNEGDLRWEVHIPFEAPTAKMNMSYFGTQDDCSVPSAGTYYVRAGNYPFAFFLSGIRIDAFKNTILIRPNESKHIDDLYPEFLDWAVSKGANNKDWYKHPVAQ